MNSIDRRTYLELLQLILPLTTTTVSPDLGVVSKPSSSSSSPSSSDGGSLINTKFPLMPNVPTTDKVFFDVRVARQDGSTYVRDDLPDTFENRVLKVRLVFGLYGTLTPNHVEKFLNYIVPPPLQQQGMIEDVDNPYPSYSRSTFTSLEQSTGLLQGGNIPSLRVQEIGGSTALTYGARVLPAPLWIDAPVSSSSTTTDIPQKISHMTKGLLTHRTLDPLPTFAVTTRACPELDSTHTVFGQILWDESILEWFDNLQDIPTYQVDRPTEYDDVGGVATTVFNAQREFFRGAAKSVGDTRISKLYEGKLLRRTEVMQVGKL